MAVSVDRDFARFGQKSYAINKINSVEVREVRPNRPDGAVILGIIAAGLLIVGISQFSESIGAGFTWVFIGILVGAFAAMLWKNSQIIEYRLFLMTSSSEAQAFASLDSDEVYGLRDRIEAAMTGRL